MRKIYMLIYNDKLGSREQVKDALDNCPLVINWRYDIPHVFYVISQSSAKEISKSLHEKFGQGRHVIAEINDNYWGRTHKETWSFIKDKGRSKSLT